MERLSSFELAVKCWLGANASWGFQLSGAAVVTDIGGSVTYSASLVPPKGSGDEPLSPTDYHGRFQSKPIEGFTYVKCQTLAFSTPHGLPKPMWRVQAIFR